MNAQDAVRDQGVTEQNVEEKKHYVAEKLRAKVLAAKGQEFIGDVKALWAYMKDNPPKAHLILGVAALLYFISPIDAIPDAIPVVGYLDDAAVIASVIATLGTALDGYRVKQAAHTAKCFFKKAKKKKG